MPAVRPVVWIPLVVFAVLAAGGLAAAIVQALAAWRAFRSFRHRVLDGLADAGRRAAQAEDRIASAAEKAARLDEARARLQESLATASVIGGAASEALALAGRIRGVVPRK